MITEKEQTVSYYSTAGDSMFPFICWNEYIVVKKVSPQDINIGDVILFNSEKNTKVAHRVVRKEHRNERLIFQAKGDHNDFIDSPIEADKVIGKVVALKRKNSLFVFSPEGIELIRYKISCFLLFVKQVLKKIARIILSVLQSTRAYRAYGKRLKTLLFNRIKISFFEKTQKHYVFIAYLFNKELGKVYLTYSDTGEQKGWWIWSLQVSLFFRRAGIGTKLVKELLEFAKNSGARGVNLNVSKENVSAVKLYQNMGFRIRENSERIYENPKRTFVYMWFKLDNSPI